MWFIGLLLSTAPLSAEQGSLNFSRDSEGVAAALGELLPQLQTCVNDTELTGVQLLRLRFEVSAAGLPGPVEPLWAPEDDGLATCLSAPFARLHFVPGEHPLPVEIPISVQIEEEYRTEIGPTGAAPVASAQ